MSFNDDFLKRQANPGELGAVVHRQESAIKQAAQSFVRVQSLDEVADEIGELQFRATSESGQLRMIMSAINLFEELGVDAHLAGIDENGVVQFYVSADDGKIQAGGISLEGIGIVLKNNSGIIYFENVAGDATPIRIYGNTNEDFVLINDAAGKALSFNITLTDATKPYILWREDPDNANVAKFEINAGVTATRVNIGGNTTPDIELWANVDGAETVFNKNGNDIDEVFYDSAGAEILRIDAAEKRLEIGVDHFIPTRNSADPNVKFNEANQDIDFIIEGTTDANLVHTDAGNDRVGVGTATPAYKLDVAGDVNISTGSVFRINGTPISSGGGGDAADITYTPSTNAHWDSATDPGDVDNALDMLAGRVYLQQIGTMADDTAFSFTPPRTYGQLVLFTRNSADLTVNGTVMFRADGSAFGIAHYLGSNCVLVTGALTDGTTDGTDTKMNISIHTDGKIYIKNRRGGNRFMNYMVVNSA